MRRADKGAGEECCAFEKKAVMKDLELPGAFEPPLEGIMVAASGLSRGSKKKKKGFGQKTSLVDTLWVPRFHCKSAPKTPATRTHKAAQSKAKVLCRVPFHPHPLGLPIPALPLGWGLWG